MRSRRKLRNDKLVSGIWKSTFTEKHTKINHELGNLENGDVLLPPDADSTSALEVVPVHDDVHEQVQSNWHPRN